jgi:hypothetical protein
MKAPRVPLFRFLLLVAVVMPSFAQAPQSKRDYVYGPGGKLATTLEPDSYPPYAPGAAGAQMAGECAESGIDVWWGTSSDIGSGLAHYVLYKNGSPLGNFTGTDYHDSDVYGGETYTYYATAVDNAGHEGDASSSAQVQVPVCWASVFAPRYFAQRAQRSFFAHVRLLNQPREPPDPIERYWRNIRLHLIEPPKPPVITWATAGGGE